jgi:hypothetical protein
MIGGTANSRAPLPATYGPTIDVDEVWARVIADPAASETQRRVSDAAQVSALRPEIDSHPLYMIAVFCHPLVTHIELPVSSRRTIAANHEERIVGVEPITQHTEDVEDASIHRPNFVGMVVPQNPVDVSDCLPNVVTVGPIDCSKPFTSMDVVERNRPRSEWDCRNRIYKTNSSGGYGRAEKTATA